MALQTDNSKQPRLLSIYSGKEIPSIAREGFNGHLQIGRPATQILRPSHSARLAQLPCDPSELNRQWRAGRIPLPTTPDSTPRCRSRH
jgi:hypothetical protein